MPLVPARIGDVASMPIELPRFSNNGSLPGFIAAAMLTASTLAACTAGTGGSGVPYVFKPSGSGKFPAVIVLHTRGGVQPHVVEFADDLSRRGYVTAVVDYFATGGVDNIEKGYDFLAQHEAVASDRIGVVGFSKGGHQAINFAYFSHRFTERRVGAIVAYYIGPDTGINDERHPPILFLHGSDDVHVSSGRLRTFCKVQRKMNTLCEAVVFQDVLHAFDHPTAVYGGYDSAAKVKAFEEAASFLDKHLKGKPAK